MGKEAEKIYNKNIKEIKKRTRYEADKVKLRQREEKRRVEEEKVRRRELKQSKPLAGRKATREKGSSAKKIRSKFSDLEIYVPDTKTSLHSYEPHNGLDPNGNWQLKFLRSKGLETNHSFLDIGCGDLAEGVPLIRFLAGGNYVGMDQNADVIDVGSLSLNEEDWSKSPQFYVGGNFNFQKMDRYFDVMWANSVFSHLEINSIALCIYNSFLCLKDHGVFMATYFEYDRDDGKEWVAEMDYRKSKSGGENEKHTYGYRNPFHYNSSLLKHIAETIGYEASTLDVDHPKGQKVLRMKKSG